MWPTFASIEEIQQHRQQNATVVPANCYTHS